MSNLYHLESEKSIWVNLESPVENLKDHQARLQKLSAAVMRDIEVVTEAIVNSEEEENAERTTEETTERMG